MLVYGAGDAFLPGAGADPIWSEPESAPGPRTSGAEAAQKNSGSATLVVATLETETDSKAGTIEEG